MTSRSKFFPGSGLARTLAVVIALSAVMSAGSTLAGTTTYKYDAQGRVIEVDYPNGWIVAYTYDAAGNRTQTVRHN